VDSNPVSCCNSAAASAFQPGSGSLLLRSQYACLLGPLSALGHGRDQLSLVGVLVQHDVAFSPPPCTMLFT
jgi:hypothetical protein